jgi:hypothetical protein
MSTYNCGDASDSCHGSQNKHCQRCTKPVPASRRCKAICKSGKRCKRCKQKGAAWCAQHDPDCKKWTMKKKKYCHDDSHPWLESMIQSMKGTGGFFKLGRTPYIRMYSTTFLNFLKTYGRDPQTYNALHDSYDDHFKSILKSIAGCIKYDTKLQTKCYSTEDMDEADKRLQGGHVARVAAYRNLRDLIKHWKQQFKDGDNGKPTFTEWWDVFVKGKRPDNSLKWKSGPYSDYHTLFTRRQQDDYDYYQRYGKERQRRSRSRSRSRSKTKRKGRGQFKYRK